MKRDPSFVKNAVHRYRSGLETAAFRKRVMRVGNTYAINVLVRWGRGRNNGQPSRTAEINKYIGTRKKQKWNRRSAGTSAGIRSEMHGGMLELLPTVFVTMPTKWLVKLSTVTPDTSWRTGLSPSGDRPIICDLPFTRRTFTRRPAGHARKNARRRVQREFVFRKKKKY